MCEASAEEEAILQQIRDTDGGMPFIFYVEEAERGPVVTEVDLGNSGIDDDSLRLVAGLKCLRYLCLEDTRITDYGLSHLRDMASLRRIVLRGTATTDEGVRRLQSALIDCEIER